MIMNSRPIHGSINPNELKLLGLEQAQLLDFSANISPIGSPKGIWEAIKSVDLSIYPDPDCLEIRGSISKHLSNSKINSFILNILFSNTFVRCIDLIRPFLIS